MPVLESSRLDAPSYPSPVTLADWIAVLGDINDLESAGRHADAVRLCEAVIDGTEVPEVHLALARNRFALASAGDERWAWPALLAALDGIEKFNAARADVAFAVGICRAVLEIFGDTHRANLRPLTISTATGDEWWAGYLPPTAKRQVGDGDGTPVGRANALLAAVPNTIRYGRPAAGVEREVQYLRAGTLSAVDPVRAREALAGKGFPVPSDREGESYERYLFNAACAERVRKTAAARGVPGLLIASLPKSASEFLCYALAEATAAAVVRVTIGEPLFGSVIPEWVEAVRGGGCVTHDHFAGTEANLAALRAGGADRVWVLVRDPRAASWSLTNMKTEYDASALPSPDEMRRNVWVLGQWIETWVRAKDAGFGVEFVKFKELTANPEAVMGGILDAAGGGAFVPQLGEVLRSRQERRQVSSNFRRGDDDAWRSHVPQPVHAALWDAIPDGVKQLLDLRP